MSWSFSAQVTVGEVPRKLIESANQAKQQHLGNPEENGWANDQVAEAILAASQLVAGGSIGHAGKIFFVTCSGHANPDHEPRPGWSDDTVTITVTQLKGEHG